MSTSDQRLNIVCCFKYAHNFYNINRVLETLHFEIWLIFLLQASSVTESSWFQMNYQISPPPAPRLLQYGSRTVLETACLHYNTTWWIYSCRAN